MKYIQDRLLVNFVDYISDWDTAYGEDNIVDKIIDWIYRLPKILNDNHNINNINTFNITFSNSGYEDTVQLQFMAFKSDFNVIDIRFPEKLRDLQEQIEQDILRLICK